MRRLLERSGRFDEHDSEAGFSTPEIVLLTPVFVLVLLLIVILGRVQQAGADITGAARDGARAASLSRTDAEARTAAERAVTAALAGQSVSCARGATTTVETGGFQPGGQVRVTVRCVVDLRDVGFTAMPGSKTLTRTSVSPIETYRSAS